jgi:hypothetical protein
MPGPVLLLPPGRLFAGLTALLAGASIWLGHPAPAMGQAAAQPQTSAASQAQAQLPGLAGSGAAARPAASKAASRNNNAKPVTKPLWNELTPAQQQALAPLASKWNTVSEAQKRKWLALSENFPRMSGAEQEKLHSRMSEWAGLTPQERTQARLNFGITKQLSPDEKKAKWEQYQALPLEEKRKLAASAAKPPATAAAVKPVAPEKLAEVPRPAASQRAAGVPRARPPGKTPRIAAAPGQVDHNTLLPQAAPASAPAPAPGN